MESELQIVDKGIPSESWLKPKIRRNFGKFEKIDDRENPCLQKKQEELRHSKEVIGQIGSKFQK
jgi:hypothetical protein